MADNQSVYCTKDDVQRWIKRVQFSESSKVTPADIDSYIQSISAVVDGELLNLGVSVPVPSSAKGSRKILSLLVSYEVASLAEQAANFGAVKNESNHGKWLHDQYVSLLEKIKMNPSMLFDIAQTSVKHMRSNTEEFLEGGSKNDEEIFTQEKIDDFIHDNKVLSRSEKSFNNNE